MNLAHMSALFHALESYRRIRTSDYRDHSASDVANALDALGGQVANTLGMSEATLDVMHVRAELIEATRGAPDRFDIDIDGTKRYLAMTIADALCDLVYPPTKPVEAEPLSSPLASAVASMRGEHPLSSNVSHDDAKACDDCGEFHALSASCVPYDTCPECRVTTGHHKLDCGKRERAAPLSMTLVNEAVPPCADPAGMGEF